jgi:hypothetical protein
MKKRAQFYLIAAFVIIGIIASFYMIYNSAKANKKDTKVQDLAEEMNYEISQLVDSGVYNELSDMQINQNIENLTDYYVASNPDIFILAVFGNQTALTFIAYNSKDIITISQNNPILSTIPGEYKIKNSTIPRQGDSVKITLADSTQYTSGLQPDRPLFIFLKKEKSGERFIASSDYK